MQSAGRSSATLPPGRRFEPPHMQASEDREKGPAPAMALRSLPAGGRRTGWRWVAWGPPWAPDLRGRAAARCHCGSSLNLTAALAAAGGGGGGGGGAASAALAGGGSAASVAAALWLGWPPSSLPRASSSAMPTCMPAPAPPSTSSSDKPVGGSSARRPSTCG